MKFTFDYYKNLESVDLYLCNPDGRELFPFVAQNRNLTLRFNDISELTFDISPTSTMSDGSNVIMQAYDYIETKRLVFATNIGWFQITNVEEHDNGLSKYKSVTTESYQSVLKNKGIYTDERVYCFYNQEDPYDDKYDSNDTSHIPSVLGQLKRQLGIKQALEQGLTDPPAPYDDWTVTYIPRDLKYNNASKGICRTFSENTTFGYDWIVNDVEDAFEVVILFDFFYKSIKVMRPSEVTERTNIVYSFNNFMNEISVTEKSDDIVTVLNCTGDNCDIATVNPTGQNYICDFSYYMDNVKHRWMSSDLIAKINTWKSECDTKKPEYTTIISELKDLYTQKTQLETSLRQESLYLEDLRNADDNRLVLGDGIEPGALAGVLIAETVLVGEKSLLSSSDYNEKEFDAEKEITAYQSYPNFNVETQKWDFEGLSTTNTANKIIRNSFSNEYSNTLYLYFSDDSNGQSYCKLKYKVSIDKDTQKDVYVCSGFERYIAVCYPLRTDGGVTYKDTVRDWIKKREQNIDNINASLESQNRSYTKVFSIVSNEDSSITFEGDEVFSDIGEVTLLAAWIGGMYTGRKYLTANIVDGRIVVSGYDESNKSYSLYIQLSYKTTSGIKDLIKSKESELSNISSSLNIINYFSDTPELLKELSCYWIEGSYDNKNIAVLEDTSPAEAINLSEELLASGYTELSKVCQPRFSFSISSENILHKYEFRNQIQELELGKIIAVEKDLDVWYYPALLEISFSLDSRDNFSLSFGNSLRLDDWGYTYADLMSDAAATSRKVGANWHDILSYSKDKETITSLIKNPLDSTLRASFANAVNQDFIVNDRGILGRKKSSENSED